VDVETECITKKPTNRAIQRYICRTEMLSSFRIGPTNYESETFQRRRYKGISHCENVEQNPQNVPFRLDYVYPHLTQQCLGPPEAPPQIAAPRATRPNNNNFSFIFTADRPQLLHNKLPRRTAQIQLNTKNQLYYNNIHGLAWAVGSYKPFLNQTSL